MHEQQQLLTPIARLPVIHPAIFYDDCNCSFNYVTDGVGGDWSAAYNTAAAHSGLKGIRLCTKETIPTSSDWAFIQKNIWASPTYLLTLQLLFKNLMVLPRITLWASLRWYDGTYVHQASLAIQYSGASVSRLIGPASWSSINGLQWCPTAGTWNHLSLSCNFRLDRYYLITVNNTIADGRTFIIPTALDAAAPHLEINLLILTSVSTRACMDFDHLLLMPDNP